MTKAEALEKQICQTCNAWSTKKEKCSSLAEDCPRAIKGKGGE
jgi:ribosomal protein L40E